MSATGLAVFDKTIHETNGYVKIVMRELETGDRGMAFGALRGALHALRDILDIQTCAHLSAQLPMLVRGLFFEGWTPHAVPAHARRLEEFLERVSQHLPPQLQGNPEEAARAVFAALRERLERGELEKVIDRMPKALHGVWPMAPGLAVQTPHIATSSTPGTGQ